MDIFHLMFFRIGNSSRDKNQSDFVTEIILVVLICFHKKGYSLFLNIYLFTYVCVSVCLCVYLCEFFEFLCSMCMQKPVGTRRGHRNPLELQV